VVSLPPPVRGSAAAGAAQGAARRSAGAAPTGRSTSPAIGTQPEQGAYHPRRRTSRGRWPPSATAGRHTGVMVNPATAGRVLRAVAALGQSRQFPTALPTRCARHSESRSDHLARNHDTCPLILDDVTVHADSARTRDILGLLLKIAELSGPIRQPGNLLSRPSRPACSRISSRCHDNAANGTIRARRLPSRHQRTYSYAAFGTDSRTIRHALTVPARQLSVARSALSGMPTWRRELTSQFRLPRP
jgi:hypothetical protein